MRKTDSKTRGSVSGVGAETHGSYSAAAEVTVSDRRTEIQQHTKKWAHLTSSKQSPQFWSGNRATNNVGRRLPEKTNSLDPSFFVLLPPFPWRRAMTSSRKGGTGRDKSERSEEGVTLANKDESYWLGAELCCSHVGGIYTGMSAWEGHVISAWLQKRDIKIAV